MSACPCGSAARAFPAGSSSASANTYTIAAGETKGVTGNQAGRRSVAITNQSSGRIVVGFGEVSALVDGPGTGYTIEAGESLSVNTTAAVTILNPQAVSATVGVITESD